MKKSGYILILPMLLALVLGVTGCKGDEEYVEWYSGVMESSNVEFLKPYVLLRITERAKPDWYPKMKVFGILKERFPLQTFKDGDMVSFKVLNIKAIDDGQYHTHENIPEYYIYEGDFELCK